MDGQHLHIIRSKEDNVIVQNRAARNARIDKLNVDRSIHSIYQGKPLPMWSEKAIATANSRRENENADIRAYVTLQEKIDAYKKIVQLEPHIKQLELGKK